MKGPNYTTVSACASSAHAIVDALNLIRLGKADAIVAGGSEAAVTVPGVGGFNSMKALSTATMTRRQLPVLSMQTGMVL